MRALRVGVLRRIHAHAPGLTHRGAAPLLLAAFAVYAGFYAAMTTLAPHRVWALCAAVGYALAAVLVLRWRRAALAALLLGTVLLPLAWLVVTGVANPEVRILADAAARWLHTGTPYPSPGPAGLGVDVNAYNAYLPVLAAAGVLAPLVDPRLLLLAATVALFWLVGRGFRAVTWLLLCCPFVALQLATGATDPPVLGLVLLALVAAGRDRPVAAGLCAGLAVAAKEFAWPAAVVVLVLLVATRGRWIRYAATALAVAAAVLVPVVVADPRAFLVNAVWLPLGMLDARLAGSPLPGSLLADAGHPTVALVLLLVAGAAVLAGMLVRPPRDAAAAARWLALGITLAVLLSPSARYGYLIYPAGLLLLPYLEGHRGAGARLPERVEAG